jgi:hypothetical protein
MSNDIIYGSYSEAEIIIPYAICETSQTEQIILYPDSIYLISNSIDSLYSITCVADSLYAVKEMI